LISGVVRIDLEDADVRLYPGVFPPARARDLFDRLCKEVDWQRAEVRLFGRRVPSPRLSAWYGEADYTYSGVTWPARPMPALLQEIGTEAGRLAGQPFNTVLANLYRSGADSMGWHADDEAELGADPVIASVVLGETRRFVFRRKDAPAVKRDVAFGAGDVLVMGRGTQRHWLHAVPKTAKPVGARINLTFRQIRLKRAQAAGSAFV
jgi:alkylated DNA repair dioxygenase AlkB